MEKPIEDLRSGSESLKLQLNFHHKKLQPLLTLTPSPNLTNAKHKLKVMENQTILNQQLITPTLTSTIQSLSTSLSAIQPNNSETTQLITYALVATAIVGILVYHYIKQQESN